MNPELSKVNSRLVFVLLSLLLRCTEVGSEGLFLFVFFFNAFSYYLNIKAFHHLSKCYGKKF